MRLIDADRLKESVIDLPWEYRVIFYRAIDNQHTVDVGRKVRENAESED